MYRSSVVGALLALVAVTGCNKVYWAHSPGTARPQATEAAAKAPVPAETIVATGELREALLSLQRVHFAYNSSLLMPGARKALAEAAKILAKHQDVQLYVDGHCDARGSDALNQRLGKERAAAVARFLATVGVGAGRLSVSSFGKEQLLASGSGVQDHAMNRRVEYRLMQGKARLVLEQGALVDDFGRALAGPKVVPATKLPPATPQRNFTEK